MIGARLLLRCVSYNVYVNKGCCTGHQILPRICVVFYWDGGVSGWFTRAHLNSLDMN